MAVSDVGLEPVEALVQALSGGGDGGLDVPVSLRQRVQSQRIGDLSSVHRVRQILLVGEDQQDGVPKVVLVEHLVQLLLRLVDAILIVRVNDENEALGVLEVVSPQRSDLGLTTDVPHRERNVLVPVPKRVE